MPSYPLTITTPDGKKITLTIDDWLHIRFRHPEVGEDPNALLQIVAKPEELYKNKRGGIHALKRIDEEHFFVVIYELEDREGYIRTAYLINDKRKRRRYRELRSLRQF
ncbi:MAG: hypothetical protein H3Z53_03865 [archaeon]|nr:hypothetical protein [archaeon]